MFKCISIKCVKDLNFFILLGVGKFLLNLFHLNESSDLAKKKSDPTKSQVGI